ncbi:MAG: flagellar basal body protein FliL [Treponema sp.]|jgi:flagellar basal body-associated protein FliL|nr:flagellar basal body protein FliL [Treponema sp.]
MKKKIKGSRTGLVLYRILIGIALLLVLIIAGGTVYAAVFHASSAADETGGDQAQANTTNEDIFAGIGKIRVLTAGTKSATVILSIAFPYIVEDKVFSEELAARVNDFRNIAVEYFMSFTLEELRRQSEQAIKDELLRRYNSRLRLGQIKRLFFYDYMILE